MNTDFVWSSPQKIWDFLRASPYSPWLQLCVVTVLLLIIVIFKGFSGGAAIETGLYICYIWIPLCAVVSLFVDDFWLYSLHWAACTLAFFIIYFLTIYLCENYGNPYLGDGAMAMLLPVYIFGFIFIGSLMIYGLINLMRYIFT